VKFTTLLLTLCLLSTVVWADRFNGFDVSDSLVPCKHIVHGGPPRDGIPAIAHPRYVSASEAKFLRANDLVLALALGGQARAYPRYILNWHELVNTEIAGQAVLVSYCPLCGTGMAFLAEVRGEKLSFGVSGLLYNSDLLFYDKGSLSLWSQLDRRAISGPYKGTSLEQIGLEVMPWWRWRQQHPETAVLDENQGYARNYRRDPYSGYETSSQLYFKTLRRAPKAYHVKEPVQGIVWQGQAKAYPFAELRKLESDSVIDEIAGEKIKLHWDGKHEVAWLSTLDGKKLVSTRAYWFAWYAFHPQTEVFRVDGSQSGDQLRTGGNIDVGVGLPPQ